MMKLTLLIKLTPTPEQQRALLETMERFNEACARAQIQIVNKGKMMIELMQNVARAGA